ncbi:MAG: HlyD family efflux transporter periplasmic adaptor subunit [Candidatus Eremiobacterota bacterium]
MKKSKIFIIFIILVIICSAGFYIYKTKQKKAEKKKDYSSVKVMKDNMEVIITATGVVKAIVQIDIKSEIGGKVIKLPHEEGETVEQGDLLAIIDDTQLKQSDLQTDADYRNNLSKLKQAETSVEFQKKNNELTIAGKKEQLTRAELVYKNAMEELTEQKEITKSAIEQATSSLEVAKKQLEKTRAGSRKQEIAAKLEQVEQAEVTMENAGKDYERQKELYKNEFVAQKTVDDAEKTYIVAKSQYEAAQVAYDMAVEGNRPEDIEISQAQVEQAEKNLKYQITKGKQDIAVKERALHIAETDLNTARINLEQARAEGLQVSMKENDLASTGALLDKSKASKEQSKDQLSKTKILSPVNALIISRAVEVGDVVASQTMSSAAGTTLMTIADLGEIYAETTIDESDIGKIKLHLPVTIMAAAYQDLKIPGIITHITPQASQVEQIPTFKIRIKILLDRIKNQDLPQGKKRYEILYPGMSVDADIYVAKKDSVLQVPLEAVWEKKGKKYVTLVTGKNTFTDSEVTTGLKNNVMIEIVTGLKENDEVKLPEIKGANQTPGTGGPPGGGPGGPGRGMGRD